MNQTPSRPRTVVMTGATNGIGAVAVHVLAMDRATRIVVGARGTGRDLPTGVEVLPLDLSSLASVRTFAQEVTRHLAGTPIDVLVLNAGTQASNLESRTADGFETTFGVNHLAHYLLARLLEPQLAEGGRLIITTSDTHDPAVTPMAPKSLDPAALAHPSGGGPGMRAYTSSKLCNLLTARSFAASPELAERRVRVIAFNPGFTVGTNLGGRSPRAKKIFTTLVVPIFSVIGRFKPEYTPGKPERAGDVLAGLTSGEITPPDGHVYVSVLRGAVTFPRPGELALDDTVRDDLWKQSAAMVGLPA